MTPAERLQRHMPSEADIDAIARRTLERLPSPFVESLSDIVLLVVPVADAETARALGLGHPMELSGLYEGVPLNHQSVDQSGMLPSESPCTAARSSRNGARPPSASSGSSPTS